MRTRKQWLALVSALAIAVILPACEAEEPAEEAAPEEPAPEEPAAAEPGAAPEISPEALPEGVTPEMVAQGQELFTGAGNCFTCHGQDATGTQLAPNLRDEEWINVTGEYDEIVTVIQTGVAQPVEHPAPMPPMGGAQLTDEQVRALAAYVYAISHGGGA